MGKCNAVVQSVHDAISSKQCPGWESDLDDKDYSNVANRLYYPFYQKECFKTCNSTIISLIGKSLQGDKSGKSIGCSVVKSAIRTAALQLKACPIDPRDPTDAHNNLIQNYPFGYRTIYQFQYCPATCGFQIGRLFAQALGNGTVPCMYKCDPNTKYQQGAALAMNKTLDILRNDSRCKDMAEARFVTSIHPSMDAIAHNPFFSLNTTSYAVLEMCRSAIYTGVLEQIAEKVSGTRCELAVKAHKLAIKKGICPDIPIQPWKMNLSIAGISWRNHMQTYYPDYCGKYESPIVSSLKAQIRQDQSLNACDVAKTTVSSLVKKGSIPKPANVSDPINSEEYGYASLIRFICAQGLLAKAKQRTKLYTDRGEDVREAIIKGVAEVAESADSFENPNQISPSSAYTNVTHPPFYGGIAQRVQNSYCYIKINETFVFLNKTYPSADFCALLKESIHNSTSSGFCYNAPDPTDADNSAHVSFPGGCIMLRNGCISEDVAPKNCSSLFHSSLASVNLLAKAEASTNATVHKQPIPCIKDSHCYGKYAGIGAGFGALGLALFGTVVNFVLRVKLRVPNRIANIESADVTVPVDGTHLSAQSKEVFEQLTNNGADGYQPEAGGVGEEIFGNKIQSWSDMRDFTAFSPSAMNEAMMREAAAGDASVSQDMAAVFGDMEEL